MVRTLLTDEGIYYLEASVMRVDMGGNRIAYSSPLQDKVIPNVDRIATTIREVMTHST